MERPQGTRFCDECPLAGDASGEIANCAIVTVRATGKVACMALDSRCQPSRVISLPGEGSPAQFGEQLRDCPGPVKFGPAPTDGRICRAFDPLSVEDDQNKLLITGLNDAARRLRKDYIAKNN